MSHLQNLLSTVGVLLLATAVLRIRAVEECTVNKNSYLWKVESSPPIYLFGTVHVPYTKLWDHIPENAKAAFGSSDDLCVELRLSDPATLTQLGECQELPKGGTIDQFLSPDTYQRLKNYLARIQELLPRWLASTSSPILGGSKYAADHLFSAMTAGWERRRPIWMMLLISSLTEDNIKSRTIPLLDLFLDNAAEGLGKRVQAVESVNDQCRPFNRLTQEQVELALRVQLDHLEQLASNSDGPQGSVERDINTYRCGDFEGLVYSQTILPLPPLDNITNITSQERAVLQDIDRYLMGQMVTRRNRKMVQHLDALLQSKRNITYFFALGAGHFLGKKSVVHRLRKKGYNVQHIPVDEIVNGTALPSNIIALGHPDSVPRIMPVQRKDEVGGGGQPGLLPTLSPEILDDIWDRYILNPTWLRSPEPEPASSSTQTPQGQRPSRDVDAPVETTASMTTRQKYTAVFISTSAAPFTPRLLPFISTSTRELLGPESDRQLSNSSKLLQSNSALVLLVATFMAFVLLSRQLN